MSFTCLTLSSDVSPSSDLYTKVCDRVRVCACVYASVSVRFCGCVPSVVASRSRGHRKLSSKWNLLSLKGLGAF